MERRGKERVEGEPTKEVRGKEESVSREKKVLRSMKDAPTTHAASSCNRKDQANCKLSASTRSLKNAESGLKTDLEFDAPSIRPRFASEEVGCSSSGREGHEREASTRSVSALGFRETDKGNEARNEGGFISSRERRREKERRGERFTRGDVLFPYFSLILLASPRRDSRLETSSWRIVGRIELGCPHIPHEEGFEEPPVVGRPAQVEESRRPSTFDLVSVEEVRRSETRDSRIGVSALG